MEFFIFMEKRIEQSNLKNRNEMKCKKERAQIYFLYDLCPICKQVQHIIYIRNKFFTSIHVLIRQVFATHKHELYIQSTIKS